MIHGRPIVIVETYLDKIPGDGVMVEDWVSTRGGDNVSGEVAGTVGRDSDFGESLIGGWVAFFEDLCTVEAVDH
jgi:hypothetical protein